MNLPFKWSPVSLRFSFQCLERRSIGKIVQNEQLTAPVCCKRKIKGCFGPSGGLICKQRAGSYGGQITRSNAAGKALRTWQGNAASKR